MIDERNVITLSGNFSYEIEDQPSRNDFTLTDAANEVLSTWKREEVTEATNPKYQFELQYKRDFEDHKDHDLIFSALGTLFSKDQSSEFTNTTQPEFTDSYEVTSIFILGETSLNAGVYQRYTTEVVERITVFEDNVSITTPRNIGTNRTTGFELNFKTIPAEFMTITGDFNYNFFSREGELEGTIFDFSADQYNGKITSKFNLPLDFDFEVTGQYQSAFQTVQSEVSDQLFADLGLRKKLFDGKGVVSFSIRDIFASRIQERVIDQPEVYQFSRRLRGRFITLGFSYGFGKGETMEYSGQRRRG